MSLPLRLTLTQTRIKEVLSFVEVDSQGVRSGLMHFIGYKESQD